ncbi:MAG: protein kinase, partial [Myxococcales bacterium]|nr:protein kinase [Myxococcales bacterium]
MAAGIRGTAPYGPAGTRPFRFGGVLGGPATGDHAADPALAIGALIDGRYEITGLVGEGGMGRVYAATHRFLGRRVALKVLHNDAQTSPESVARFRQEALLCTRIGHPGIVEVLDCATFGEGRRSRVFMVMELLE